VGVRCNVGAPAFGLLDDGADLVQRERRAVQAGAAGDAPGREDLEEVGSPGKVFTGGTAHLVWAVEPPAASAMPVRRGEAPGCDREPRALQVTVGDGLAGVDVEPVLLAHDAKSGGARIQVPAQVARDAQGLSTGRLPQLPQLVAPGRDDREVCVSVDEPGHHEQVREVDDVSSGRRGTVNDRVVFDHQRRICHRVGPGRVEEPPAVDHHHRRVPPGAPHRAVASG